MGRSPLAQAQSTASEGVITYFIDDCGTADWHVQLKQEGLSLTSGVTYHVSFDATSNVDRAIKSGVQNGTDYTWYGGQDDIQLQAGMEQSVSFDVQMTTSDTNGVFCNSMGKTDEGTPTTSVVTLSNLSITYEATGEGTRSYTSGRVNTQDKNTFTYGLFECRAKVPEGAGYLPAF